MANKIVNLDDEKNSVTIIVEGREFTISRIVLKARQLYGEYLIFCGNYLTMIGDMNKKVESATKAELETINVKLEKDIEEFAIKKAAHLNGLAKIIMEKNGYDFDLSWWEENADYQVMEQFILTAMKKDESPVDTKKKEAIAS